MNYFPKLFAKNWPPERWQSERTILACSGGADSVALVRVMHALAENQHDHLIIAHFNHRLRGDASDADEQFVTRLAQQLGISCKVGHAKKGRLKKSGQDGLEAAARTARYTYFRDLANEQAARYIVTAHTADDQVETILHHILRGTGLSGLTGIPRTRIVSELTTIVRPLLPVTRSQVIDYLSSLAQPFCEDISNQDLVFTRNRLRHSLLPQLEQEYNPQVRPALLRLAQQASETIAVLDRATSNWYERGVIDVGPRDVILKWDFFKGKPLALIRHFLVSLWVGYEWPRQGMSFEHWDHLARLIRRPEKSKAFCHSLPGGFTLTKLKSVSGWQIEVPKRRKADAEAYWDDIHLDK